MQSEDVKKIVSNLERWRHSRGLTQSAMAKRLGMSLSAYKKLLSGERGTISSDTIKTIYQVTGMLCFQMMEYIEDDYLKLTDAISKLTPKERKAMYSFYETLIKLRE